MQEKVGLVEKNDQARMKIGNIAGYINARITRCFISGFPMNIVQLGPTGYQTMGRSSGGLNVSVHPTSILFVNHKEKAQRPSKYVLYQQLMLTSKEFIRDCLVIPKEEWLIDMVPQIFKDLIDDKTNRGGGEGFDRCMCIARNAGSILYARLKMWYAYVYIYIYID